MRSSFWMIHVSLKSNDVCPSNRKAEGDLIRQKRTHRHRGDGYVKMRLIV